MVSYKGINNSILKVALDLRWRKRNMLLNVGISISIFITSTSSRGFFVFVSGPRVGWKIMRAIHGSSDDVVL